MCNYVRVLVPLVVVFTCLHVVHVKLDDAQAEVELVCDAQRLVGCVEHAPGHAQRAEQAAV